MRIVFTGGGTLGSVTPLVAAAAELRRLDPGVRLDWIGTRTGPEAGVVAAAGLDFHAISSGKLRRYFSFANFIDPFRIAAGFFQALGLLGRLRPDAVVSAGGFVAVPAVWAAAVRRIPVHVHQEDIRPGLANKLTAPFAASVSVAFESSLKDFAGRHPVWTGNPVRAELFTGSRQEARRLFGLEEGTPTVLVIGGGTGAGSLNELVRKALPGLIPAVQVLHLTGRGKLAPPADAPSRYRQIEFLGDDMRHAYAAADLVVTRAGMGVLTELAALGLPAVIVPMPDSHQEDNAAFFGRAGAAEIVSEKSTFSKAFAEAIVRLAGDRPRLDALRAAMSRLNRPDAASAVARMIMAAARRAGRS